MADLQESPNNESVSQSLWCSLKSTNFHDWLLLPDWITFHMFSICTICFFKNVVWMVKSVVFQQLLDVCRLDAHYITSYKERISCILLNDEFIRNGCFRIISLSSLYKKCMILKKAWGCSSEKFKLKRVYQNLLFTSEKRAQTGNVH